MNIVKVEYRHIPFGTSFSHEGKQYIKTSFNRGCYFEDGRKKFRNFKKRILVESSNEIFKWENQFNQT